MKTYIKIGDMLRLTEENGDTYLIPMTEENADYQAFLKHKPTSEDVTAQKTHDEQQSQLSIERDLRKTEDDEHAALKASAIAKLVAGNPLTADEAKLLIG